MELEIRYLEEWSSRQLAKGGKAAKAPESAVKKKNRKHQNQQGLGET